MNPDTITLPRPAFVPLDNTNNNNYNNNKPPGDSLVQLAHPLAAGAVALQTMVVQPLMDKMGEVFPWHAAAAASACAMDSAPIDLENGLSLVSHVAMNAMALFGAPSSMCTMGIRAATVLAQVLSTSEFHLSSSQSITAPEECIFQLVSLYVALTSLFQHVSHHAVSSTVPSSKEYRAYQIWMKPHGMTLKQFNTLSSFAVDWVTLDEGQIVEPNANSKDDSALYWLYKGTVQVQPNPHSSSSSSYTLHANPLTQHWSAAGGASTGVLGELEFLRAMDGPSRSSSLSSSPAHAMMQAVWEQVQSVVAGPNQTEPTPQKKEEEECLLSSSCESWTTGPGGATLLRLDTTAAVNLLHQYDESLEQPLRNLVWHGLHAKRQMGPTAAAAASQ